MKCSNLFFSSKVESPTGSLEMGTACFGPCLGHSQGLKTTTLRKTIAEFEASNTTTFQPLHIAINQTTLFPDHLQNIRKLSVWGTNLEILAATSLFQLDVYLATETYHLGVPTWLLYPPKPMFTLSKRELKDRLDDKVNVTGGWIELLHVSNSRFDNIKPLPGHCHKLLRPTLLPNSTQDEVITLS